MHGGDSLCHVDGVGLVFGAHPLRGYMLQCARDIQRRCEVDSDDMCHLITGKRLYSADDCVAHIDALVHAFFGMDGQQLFDFTCSLPPYADVVAVIFGEKIPSCHRFWAFVVETRRARYFGERSNVDDDQHGTFTNVNV